MIGPRPTLAEAGPEAGDLTDVGFVQTAARQGAVATRTDLSAIGGSGLLITGESARSRRYLIAVLTAQTPAALLDSTRALVHPARWSQLDGRAIVWRPELDTVAVQPVAETFHTGDISRGERASYFFSRHAVAWIGGIAAMLAALAGGLTYLSRKLKRADSRQRQDFSE